MRRFTPEFPVYDQEKVDEALIDLKPDITEGEIRDFRDNIVWGLMSKAFKQGLHHLELGGAEIIFDIDHNEIDQLKSLCGNYLSTFPNLTEMTVLRLSSVRVHKHGVNYTFETETNRGLVNVTISLSFSMAIDVSSDLREREG